MKRVQLSLFFLLGLCVCLASAATAQDVAVNATDQYEYSYSSETEREIAENWLDVSYRFGEFRTGLLLNSRQPSEEGFRENSIKHRFFEFSRGNIDVRLGHFYALFGRGLVLSAYENRLIRVDTALDGVLLTARRGRFTATLVSGTPSALDRDVRAIDVETDLGRGWMLGTTGLTYFIEETGSSIDGPVQIEERERVLSGRITKYFDYGDLYVEYGWKSGYDYLPVPNGKSNDGHVLYGAANLYYGPLALAVEAKDYDKFAVLKRADGIASLNKPPSLTREHVYSLLGRHSNNLNPDDEKGLQAELSWSLPHEWSLIGSANRTRNQAGHTIFEEAYVQIEKEQWGDFRAKGAFGYQDAEGLRQTGIGETTWLMNDQYSLTLIWEHQHVRGQGTELYRAGEFDVDYFTLELSSSPTWSLSGVLEVNNKYLEQRDPGERGGPFPAMQLSYFSPRGDSIALWFGRRQAGQLCSGGVCKYEPDFEGAELFGLVRY